MSFDLFQFNSSIILQNIFKLRSGLLTRKIQIDDLYRLQKLPIITFLSLATLITIFGIVPAFGQTANEIDIAAGAGSSASAACVAANDCFYPNLLTVTPGTTVTWRNTDTTMHVVCSGTATDDTCGTVFEDDSLKPGQTFQFTFANSGTYNYFCSVHPWMTGQVIVSSSVSNTQPPPTCQPGYYLASNNLCYQIVRPPPTCQPGYYYHASNNLCYPILPPSLTLETPNVNGLGVTISGQAQSNTFGSSISRISWDWGDGYVLDGGFPQSHIYSQVGSYNVKVTAYDNLGYSHSVSQIVTVTQPPPTCQQGYYLASNNQCYQLISPTLNAVSQVDGLTVTISGSSQAMTFGSSISKIQVDWGDGQTSSDMNLPQSHTYLQDGTYSIKVTSFDNMGYYNSLPIQVTVTSYVPHSTTPSTQTIRPSETIPQADVPLQGTVVTSTSDGLLEVSVNYVFERSSDGKGSVDWNVFFKDSNGELIPHSNYAISVMQSGQQLLHQTANYASSGVAGGQISDLKSFDPMGFNITYLGTGLQYADPSTWNDPKGDNAYLEIPNVDLKSNPSDTTITVLTNKDHYTKGDMIRVVGVAIASGSVEPVGLSITDPNGNEKNLPSSQIDNQNTFSSLINIDDSLMNGNGKYTITASYHNTLAKTEISIAPPKTCFLFWCW